MVEDSVDGAGVVFDVEPVAHVFALTVNGERLAMAYVVDEERDELLGELVGAVVVGAVRDDGRHAVSVVESADEMVAGGFRSGVRAVGLVLRCLVEEVLAVGQVVLRTAGCRGERRLDAFGICHLQSPIHLVGGDVIEAFAFVLLWQAFPIELGSLQEGECAHDVCTSEGEGILDAAIDVALSGEVDDAVHLLVLHQLQECVEVADVHLHELIVRLILDVLEVGEVAGIGQLVEVDDLVLRVFVDEEAYYMAADKTGAACDNDGKTLSVPLKGGRTVDTHIRLDAFLIR